MRDVEGVVRFDLDFAPGPAPAHPAVAELARWFKRLRARALVGRDPRRYDGLAYGNLSARSAPGRFVITGTQTAGRLRLSAAMLSEVVDWNIEANRVRACGPVPPSSESLTHAALYQADDRIQFVFHAHCPTLWADARWPVTDRGAGNGTPEMARAVASACRAAGADAGLLRLGGHRDGVVGYGPSAQAAGSVLLEAGAPPP